MAFRKVAPGPIPNSTLVSSAIERMWRLDERPRHVYVAATLSEQGAAARFALQLIDAGFNVTSTWLREDFSRRPRQADDWRRFVQFEEQMGCVDVEDVRRSDTLIVLVHEPSASGGYHVELGMFLGAGKTNIVVVGERPNVFYWTEHVRFCRDTEGLVEWLSSLEHSVVEPSTKEPFASVHYDDSPDDPERVPDNGPEEPF